jgi:hypothetical protein
MLLNHAEIHPWIFFSPLNASADYGIFLQNLNRSPCISYSYTYLRYIPVTSSIQQMKNASNANIHFNAPHNCPISHFLTATGAHECACKISAFIIHMRVSFLWNIPLLYQLLSLCVFRFEIKVVHF